MKINEGSTLSEEDILTMTRVSIIREDRSDALIVANKGTFPRNAWARKRRLSATIAWTSTIMANALRSSAANAERKVIAIKYRYVNIIGMQCGKDKPEMLYM